MSCRVSEENLIAGTPGIEVRLRFCSSHPGSDVCTVIYVSGAWIGSAGAQSPGKTSSEVAFTIKGRRVRAWLTSVGMNLIPVSAPWWTPWARWYHPPDCIPFEEILSACARNRPSRLPCTSLHQACTHALLSIVYLLLCLHSIRGVTECLELIRRPAVCHNVYEV